MAEQRYPKVGENWCLKSDPKKVAQITSVDISDEYEAWGYVGMITPWLEHGHSGRPMDTFLKQYRMAAVNE